MKLPAEKREQRTRRGDVAVPTLTDEQISEWRTAPAQHRPNGGGAPERTTPVERTGNGVRGGLAIEIPSPVVPPVPAAVPAVVPAAAFTHDGIVNGAVPADYPPLPLNGVHEDETPAPAPPPPPAAHTNPVKAKATVAEKEAEEPKVSRLMALDAFRGLTIALMLLVNNIAMGEHTPKTLAHAHGGDPTLADLVFPWFLLAVGVSIPFSAASKKEKGLRPWQSILGVARRALVLFGVGLLVDSSIRHEPFFGLGVLQLIALSYFVGRCLYLLPWYLRLGLAAGCLAWYGWSLTQSSLFNYSPTGQFSEEQNLARYLNENLLAPYRLQGLPSVVPTAGLVLIGALVGDIIRFEKWVPGARASLLVVLGAASVIIGTLWGMFLPMDKPFWTPSYILYAGGWGILALAFFFLTADIIGGRVWPLRLLALPLVVYGTNALVAYAGAILVKVHILQEWQITVDGQKESLYQAALALSNQQFGDNGGWWYTGCYLVAVWFLCAFLYHKKIFLRA